MKAVFDSNILIDYLNGIPAAADELALYDEKVISVITFIEVLVGATNPKEEPLLRSFLSAFKVHELSSAVAELSVKLRKQHHLKVPDAIVYATARNEGCILVTRNTKDFNVDWPDVRAPYQV
jgi:predicted nucleic acid-binding protein